METIIGQKSRLWICPDPPARDSNKALGHPGVSVPFSRGGGGQEVPQGPERNLTVCCCLSSAPAPVQQVPTLQHPQLHRARARGGETPPPRPELPPREAAPTGSAAPPRRRAPWTPFSPLCIATAVILH